MIFQEDASAKVEALMKANQIKYTRAEKGYEVELSIPNSKRKQKLQIKTRIEGFRSIKMFEISSVFLRSAKEPIPETITSLFTRKFELGGIVYDRSGGAFNFRFRQLISISTNKSSFKLITESLAKQADLLEQDLNPYMGDRF